MIWTEHRLVPMRDADGEVTAVAGIARDVTALKVKEAYLSHRALHDPLTGLPNRVLLLDRLEAALARLRRHPTFLAVLYLDLDRFKTVNDNLGHEVGDRLLHVVARRLQDTLRPSDSVARLGGDEFAAILPDLGDAHEAIQIAERLLAAVAEPVDLGEGDLVTTVSIGIAGARRRWRQRGRAAAPGRLRHVHGQGPGPGPGRVLRRPRRGRPRRTRAPGRHGTRPLTSADGLRPAAVPARPPRPGAGGRGGGARRHGRRVGRHAGRPDARRRASARSPTRRPVPPATRPPSAAPRCREAAAAWIDAPLRLRRSPPTRWSRASAPRSWSRRCRGCSRCAIRRATPCSTRRSRTRPTRWAPCSPGCGRCRCRSTTAGTSTWRGSIPPTRRGRWCSG